MRRLIIFLTGAAILALQLIASRIMAPFFGASLYIWTGILSITLLCLALGYALGGRFTRRASPADVAFAFYLLPAVSGIALALSSLAYPVLLGPLARFDLLLGSFAGCAVLLAVPLTALSALNPILVATERAQHGESASDDAGAGAVFFVSTVGSVAGVLAAAFYFIPRWSNLESVGQIGALVGLLGLSGSILARDLTKRQRACAAGLALAGIAGSLGAAYWMQPGTGQTFTGADGHIFSLRESVPSPFGTLKVLDVRGPGGELRILSNDGLTQNGVFADGTSSTPFTYVLDIAAAQLVPQARRALVLGLGAGIVPTSFAKRGIAVDVVEINPHMEALAEKHFSFRRHPAMSVHIEDARTFVQDCREGYDVVIVDLFFGDGTPEHLVTADFFNAVRKCLREPGLMAMNSFLDARNSRPFIALLATVARVFNGLAVVQGAVAENETSSNGYLFAARGEVPLERLRRVELGAKQNVPPTLAARIQASFGTTELLSPHAPALRYEPAQTDERNRLAHVAVGAQIAYRRQVVTRIPDALLVN